MGDVENVLSKIYYDINHPAGFGGVNKLYNAAKDIIPSLKLDQVKKWLEAQDTYTLFKPAIRRYLRLPILVDHMDEQWQADLMDMTWFSEYNDGVKYLLTVVDVLSRYAWVRPLKSKDAHSIKAAFDSIFAQGRQPQKLQTDQGKEFVNNLFNSFLKINNVHFFTSTDDQIKCAIVERFNRTLRTKIYRFIFFKNSNRYIDDLQNIVDSYNSSEHRIIKMAPKMVTKSNEAQVLLNIRKSHKKQTVRSKPLTKGQTVRIQRKKGDFEKGATSSWTNEIFQVDKTKKTPQKYIYKLKDLSGEPITSIFYPEELTPVSPPKLYKVEKVVSTRINPLTKKLEYYVKWLGYPDKFNSWVDEIQYG
jgi:transposase InsO family protein